MKLEPLVRDQKLRMLVPLARAVACLPAVAVDVSRDVCPADRPRLDSWIRIQRGGCALGDGYRHHAAMSFLVFTFGSLLVAIQIASGQLTPRIIVDRAAARQCHSPHRGTVLFRTAVRHRRAERWMRFRISSSVLRRSSGSSPRGVPVPDRLCGADTAAGGILWRVGEQGLRVIQSVYPKSIEAAGAILVAPRELGPPTADGRHQRYLGDRAGSEPEALIAEARKMDGIIELVPRVGDFVAVGDPLFCSMRGSAAIDDAILRGPVAFGPERTIEQDTTFAFRVIVDIAIKALVQGNQRSDDRRALHRPVHRLLRTVGKRHLHDDQVFDREGNCG